MPPNEPHTIGPSGAPGLHRLWGRMLRCALALWAATWLLLAPAWAQTPNAGVGGSAEDDAPLQILTSDLARVQTINAPRVAVTFVILGKSEVQRVVINGEAVPIVSDPVVVINRSFDLTTPENLIEISAEDDAGNRREKTFMVLRKVFTQQFSWEERRAAVLALIEAGRFDDARIELSLWEGLQDHPETVEELWRLLDDRSTADIQHEVLELILGDRFDEAFARIAEVRSMTARPVVANSLMGKLASRKRTVLRGEIEILIVQHDFEQSGKILKTWEAAGDSPDMVAALQAVRKAWQQSPEHVVELRDLHANSRVFLQVRRLTPGRSGWEASDALAQAAPQLIGAGSGRYPLPGPGDYVLSIVQSDMHDTWQTRINTADSGVVQVLQPDLTYHVNAYRWLKRPPLSLPRAAPGLMRNEGELELVGGYQELRYDRPAADKIFLAPRDTSVYSALDEVEVYSTALLDWQGAHLAQSAPKPAFLFGGVRLGRDVYVVANSGKLWQVSGDWATWRELPSPLGAFFGRPTVAALDGKLYVIGGLTIEAMTSSSEAVQPVPSRSVWMFDLATARWSEQAPLPRPLGGATAATVGDRIYVIGGTDSKDLLNTVYAFSPAANSWTALAPILTGRAFAGSAVVNGHVYVIGGEGNGLFGRKALSSVEIFDPIANAWGSGAELPTARKDPGVAVVAGGIYVVGGFDGVPLNAFDLYATSAHLTPPAELPGTTPFGSQLRQRRTVASASRSMVDLPGGEFVMGRDVFFGSADTRPEHTVQLDPFKMDESEVTQEAFELIMGFNPSAFKGPRNPVHGVTWFQAKQYCEKIGKRLPTEAEWEYAARDGRATRYYFGESGANADQYENFCGTICLAAHQTSEAFLEDDRFPGVAPVMNYDPNHAGIFDLLGNLSEWVADWFGDYPTERVNNPLGPASGETKVYRGGSYRSLANVVRSTDRYSLDPNGSSSQLGFRCAADVKAQGDAASSGAR